MVSAGSARNHDQRAREALERQHGAPQCLGVGEAAAADREQDVAIAQPDLGRPAAACPDRNGRGINPVHVAEVTLLRFQTADALDDSIGL